MKGENCLAFINAAFQDNRAENTVVFTHHAPTFLNYPKQYKGDILNEAFAVELFELIESSDIEYWVYGHHHSNVTEFALGNTKLITNQLGYAQNNEHLLFDPGKSIDLFGLKSK